jgi:cell wall-associated NlpC family hydrolase
MILRFRRIKYGLILLAFPWMVFQSKAQTQQTERPETVLEKLACSADRDTLISYAKYFLGSPYHYGSSSPTKGFDCSGFVNFVFKKFKIKLPRSSEEFKNMGKDLKPEEFKPGDVVVFYGFKNKARIGHVGIICEANGMKSKFIHSSSGVVKGVIISELGFGMYASRFFKCIDVISNQK